MTMSCVTANFEFFCDQFEVDAPEDGQPSPGRQGRALGEWVRAGLAPDGPPLVGGRDGWRLDFPREHFRLWVGVGLTTDLRQRPQAPQPLAWRCSVCADVSFRSWFFWHRLLGVCSPEDDVLALAVRLGDRLRSNPRISELERWDHH